MLLCTLTQALNFSLPFPSYYPLFILYESSISQICFFVNEFYLTFPIVNDKITEKDVDFMIHLYIGDGKGKSTAAAGLCVRMAGYGKKILFAQFLKNGKSGEIAILKNFCDILCDNCCDGFLWSMDEEKKALAKSKIREIIKSIDSKKYDLIVLDEILDCICENIITDDECLELLNGNTEYVLTGRCASEKLCNSADYISRIEKIKHPFDNGCPAREGIEY